MDDSSAKRAKRPYERPTLEASSIFGAEAMTGSCCRGAATCTNATRDTQRITVDALKQKNSVNS